MRRGGDGVAGVSGLVTVKDMAGCCSGVGDTEGVGEGITSGDENLGVPR